MAGPENQIGDAGARALADAIKDIKALENMRLVSECVIGCWPSPTIANATRTSPIHPASGGPGRVRGCVVDGCECAWPMPVDEAVLQKYLGGGNVRTYV